MDESYELLGTGLLVGGFEWRVGCGRGDGGFIVEAIEVAADFLEFFDPFLGL